MVLSAISEEQDVELPEDEEDEELVDEAISSGIDGEDVCETGCADCAIGAS